MLSCPCQSGFILYLLVNWPWLHRFSLMFREHHVTQCAWPGERTSLSVLSLNFLAFSENFPLLSPRPSLVLAFWPVLVLVTGKSRVEKGVASCRPHLSQAPTTLGQHPVLPIVPQVFTLGTNKPVLIGYSRSRSRSAYRESFVVLFFNILFSFIIVKKVTGSVSLNIVELIIVNSILKSVFLINWLCFSVFLSCSHFGQDNLCSPSDILQLNLSVKRTVETLLSLGAHSEESSFVSLSIQLLGFVAFYCTLMLTLCMLYYWSFPL